ncbi:MAG: PTS sugar transporter subunit IIA, partial [Kiritimatiellae bacterium]|nr:PTS sugar transporter subunit IIA [Kiritimatiellia bacterium]
NWKDTLMRPGRGLANPMIILNVTGVMKRVDPENAELYNARARESVEDIFNYHVKPELGCTLESVGPNGETRLHVTEGRMVNPGHDIECSWFLMDYANDVGDKEVHAKAAQGQQVRLGEHLVTCSSCGRILFAAEEDAARNVTEPADRDDAPRTGISRFSAEELMLVDLGPVSREEAITALAGAMEEHKFIANADSLVTAALERESVLSTAIDGGIAFPHVRGVEGGGLCLAMGVSREGIDWDGQKVNLVFLSAIPVAVSAFYLRLMSGLMQSFAREPARRSVIEAKDPTALWKALCKATRVAVK